MSGLVLSGLCYVIIINRFNILPFKILNVASQEWEVRVCV